MSELFKAYEDNVKKSIMKIGENSDLIKKSIEKNQIDSINSSFFNDTYNFITEAEKMIKKMQIESSTTSNREAYDIKINNYLGVINKFKKEIRKNEEIINEKQKVSLLFDQKLNEKKGLISNEEYAYSGSQKLEEAKRVLSATEDTSNKIMNNMEEQTNKMKGVNVKIKTMNNNIDGSSNLLSKMQGRLKKNKKIIIIFGIILVGIFVGFLSFKIIFKFFK